MIEDIDGKSPRAEVIPGGFVFGAKVSWKDRIKGRGIVEQFGVVLSAPDEKTGDVFVARIASTDSTPVLEMPRHMSMDEFAVLADEEPITPRQAAEAFAAMYPNVGEDTIDLIAQDFEQEAAEFPQ